MAQPSSSHREHRDRDHGERSHRERSSSSRHQHRTISSTTLLLVLSLVLAVLAVMLSLPNQSSSATAPGGEQNPNTLLSYISPKRSQQLISREGEVARREAEVARREADILAGAPGGVNACAPCQATTVIETVVPPMQTVIQEIVKESALTPPGWKDTRSEEILDRELRIAEREREISKREENVNRREHDAARREGWIMEQLIGLGNDNPQTVEDEYVYEPVGVKRKAKQHQPQYHHQPPPPQQQPQYQQYREPQYQYEYEELPPIVAETTYATVTQTVTVPAPSRVGGVPSPAPEVSIHSATSEPPRTTAVEIVTEEIDDEPVLRRPARRGGPPPKWGWGAW